MRRIVPLVAILALWFAAPAQADIVNAEGGAGAGGHRLTWTLAFDDVADTVTVDATHARFSGAEQLGPPSQAQIVLLLSNGQGVRVNLLTAQLFSGTNGNLLGLFDGDATSMINDGPRTRTNVRLNVGAGRGRVITFSTLYSPPV